MTFTPKFQKTLRRKKRKDSSLGTQRQREIRRMTKTARSSPERRIYATAVALRDQPGKVGVWVWTETAPNFMVAGDTYPQTAALGAITAIAPEAVLITPQEFKERTQHVRHAGEEN